MIHKYRSILLLTVIILVLWAGPAFAAGYNSDSETTGSAPHGGYTTTGNKCKSCHAVHLAGGQYRLLRSSADNASTACKYCHGDTGIVTTKRVWLDDNGHGLSAEQTGDVVIPDDTTYTAFRNDVWSCVACHSPHGANTVTLSEEPSVTSSFILRKFPNPSKLNGNAYYTGTTGTLTITAWCSNCHEANFGSHTEGKSTPAGTRYGHDSSTTGYQLSGGWVIVAPDDATNTGPKCQQCHTADRAPTNISQGFPHAGGDSWKMLKSSSTTGTTGTPIEGDKLDKFCAGSPCHDVTKLP